MKVCLTLPQPRGVIFPDLNDGRRFCIDIPILVFSGIDLPGPVEDAWSQLRLLAAIRTLAAALPERNPLRADLHELATRSLQEAVADLGEGVDLDLEDTVSSL